MAIYLCMTLPFTIVQLYYSYNEPVSICMDQGDSGLVVRPWFRGIGITECVIDAGFLLSIMLLCCMKESSSCFECTWILMILAAVIKTIVWAVASNLLFDRRIKEQCDGSIYAFGLAVAIINAIYFVGLFFTWYSRR